MDPIARIFSPCPKSIFAALALGFSVAAGQAQAGMPTTTVAELNLGLKEGYQIGTGDKLRITVFDEPTLTNDYVVNDSGAIAFPLIDDVSTSQLTTSQLAAKIAAQLKTGGYVLSPKVAVEIVEHRPFYILGEVAKPGEYPYKGELTLSQAVATAGGYTARANKGTIKLLRQSSNRAVRVRVEDAPLKVAPGDTVIIPEAFF